MNLPLVLLVATGTLGAFDVLYYHLYRFRLFARGRSAGEELTHLIRHVSFLGMLALLASGVTSAAADAALLALFAIDLVNSTADILLEPASRADLGGVPAGETLVHVGSSFGLGATLATYLSARSALPLPPPTGLLAWQVDGMLAIGVVLFVIEAALFVRARAALRIPVVAGERVRGLERRC